VVFGSIDGKEAALRVPRRREGEMSRSREPIAVLTVVCLVSLALVSAGCGKSEPPVEWKTTKELPANFPADVPVYPNAQLDTVVSGKGSVIFWHTTDPVPAVQAFYTKELNAKGWHVTTYPVVVNWMGEDGVTLIGTVWGRQVSVSVARQKDRTVISALLRD
jgi:hypothetical protein